MSLKTVSGGRVWKVIELALRIAIAVLEKAGILHKVTKFWRTQYACFTAIDKYWRKLMKTKILSDSNNPITVFWKNTLKKPPWNYFFKSMVLLLLLSQWILYVPKFTVT